VDWLLKDPWAMRVIGFLVHALFPAVVFAIGTTVHFRDILHEFRRSWLMARTLWVACVVVPVMTAAVVKVLHVPLLLGGVMLIAAVAPGDPFDLVEAKGKKGNLALASTIFPMLVLVMPFTVPLWLAVFTLWFPLHLTVSPLAIFREIARPTPCSRCWEGSPFANGSRPQRRCWRAWRNGSRESRSWH
jgi:predicted Na+-dependent transporter